MRTRALLCLAALAVSAATCVAQSNVYSLNIVGYVNVDLVKGMNLIANPLKPSNGNYNITNTIALPDALDGSQLFKWGGTAWSTTVPGWVAGFGWDDANTSIQLGEAFFLNATAAGKVTFVGEVATGKIDYTFNKGVNFVANKVPVAEAFPGSAVGNDGDNIFTWAAANKAWSSDVWNYVAGAGGGWFSSAGSTGNNGPTLQVGQGAVYQNTGNAALNWSRTFSPQ